MVRQTIRNIVLVLLCWFLAGCSSTTFFYNRLDFLVPWYVDGYAGLDNEQEAYLDEQLAPFLDWHRSSELPCYVILLDDIKTTIEGEVTVEDIEALSVEFEQAWYRTQDEALVWLLDLGEQLSDKQVEKFLAELDEKQEELAEKYLDRDDEEFHEDAYDNMLDTGKDYLGRLEKSQREEMRAASDQLLRSDRLWLQERGEFIARLAQLLQREPGWQDRVRELVDEQSQQPAPEYLEVVEHNVAVLQALTVSLLNGRTERQDAHLRKELAKLHGEFQTLIAQAGQPASCAATQA